MHQILKGSVESPQEEIDKIRKITVEQIKDVAKKIFIDENIPYEIKVTGVNESTGW